MKKISFVRNTILFFLGTIILPTVSAAPFDFYRARDFTANGLQSILGILSPFLEAIMGEYSTSEFFFYKFLLLILLVIIIKNIIDRTPFGEGKNRAGFFISVIVSILSIRFINENKFFEAIFIQYGVLGIAITTILPTVIFFYFVHNTKVGTYGRKIFWTIYGIILTVLWLSKSKDLPVAANWIYGLTILAAIIFIFFDKSIHGYFGLADFKKFEKNENKEAILRAKERLHKAQERLNNGIISHYDYQRVVDQEEKLIRELSKEV